MQSRCFLMGTITEPQLTVLFISTIVIGIIINDRLAIEIHKIRYIEMAAKSTCQIRLYPFSPFLIVVDSIVRLCMLSLVPSIRNNTKVHGIAEDRLEVLAARYGCLRNAEIADDRCNAISALFGRFQIRRAGNSFVIHHNKLPRRLSSSLGDVCFGHAVFCLHEAGGEAGLVTGDVLTVLDRAVGLVPYAGILGLCLERVDLCAGYLLHIVGDVRGVLNRSHQIQVVCLCHAIIHRHINGVGRYILLQLNKRVCSARCRSRHECVAGNVVIHTGLLVARCVQEAGIGRIFIRPEVRCRKQTHSGTGILHIGKRNLSIICLVASVCAKEIESIQTGRCRIAERCLLDRPCYVFVLIVLEHDKQIVASRVLIPGDGTVCASVMLVDVDRHIVAVRRRHPERQAHWQRTRQRQCEC